MTKGFAARIAHIALLSVSPAAVLAIAASAAAERPARSFDIPAQALSAAVLEFSRQADVMVVLPPEYAAGKRSAAVKGSLPVDVALDRLVRPSGLRGIPNGAGGYRVAPLAEAPVPGTARAYPAAQTELPDAAVGDIVVTAQRFEQKLHDVPMSVSAIGAKELQDRNAHSLKEFEYSVPGLSSFEYGVGYQFLQLRGVASTIGASTIGTYLDETPLAVASQGAEMQVPLLDMERVEVLRGPQATLYGQGSMGGTIRYIPAEPKFDRVSGSAEAQVSTTKGGAASYEGNAAINLPIVTDKVGLRIAAGYEHVGGWIDQKSTGDRNINSANIWSIRGILRLKPSERLDISILGLHQSATQASTDFARNDVTTALLKSPGGGHYSLIQGKASYDVDFATISGSASYIDRKNVTNYDISGFYVPILPAFGIPAGSITTVGLESASSYRIFNSELRLASNSTGPFHWQLGGTYRDYKVRTVSTTPTAPNPPPFVLVFQDLIGDYKSYALYGEGTYDLTSNLHVTAGLRYYSETKDQTTANTSFGTSRFDVNNATFHSVNPHFNVSYAFSPESMVYANVAKGFRSGGFNLTSAGGGTVIIPPSYKPDEIWTYEVGTKHQLFGNRLILDASLYRSVWSGVQSNVFVPNSAITVVSNSGHVQGWGVDFSAAVRPTRDLTLNGAFGWNNLAFNKAVADKLPGDPVDGAVRTSYSASLDYHPRLSEDVNGIFRLDYQHAGKSRITYRNLATGQIVRRPGRNIVNARIGIGIGPMELAVFADNLFNERNPLITGPFGVFSEDLEQRPRVIGLSANTKF